MYRIVIDQSLWNPDYSGYDFQTVAHVPGIDVSAYYLLIFVSGHVIYSIGTPAEVWRAINKASIFLLVPVAAVMLRDSRDVRL